MPVLINNDSGLAENLPADVASSATAAGTHEVPLANAQTGDIESFNQSDAASAVKAGTHSQLNQDQLGKLMKTAKYSGTGEQIKAGLEGVAQGVAGPLAPLAEKAMGVTDEAMQARQELNPITHDVGVGVGLVGSSLADFGLGAGLNAVGKAATVAAGLEKGALLFGSKAAAKIASAAVSGGIENATFQAQDELSKYIMGNPAESIGSAMMDVGMAGFLGIGMGAALGTVPAGWDALMEGKVGKHWGDFKGRIEQMRNISDPVGTATSEAAERMKSLQDMNSDLWGKSGLKAQNIDKLAPELSDTVHAAAQDTVQTMQESIDKMSKKTSIYGDRYTGLLQENMADFQKTIQEAKNTSEIFTATNDLKKQLSSYIPNHIMPDNPAYNAVKEFQGVVKGIKEGLENNKVWGKLGEFQSDTNKAASEFFPTDKDFKAKFTSKVEGDHTVDPGKINTYINQLGKPNAELKQGMMQSWLDAGDKYKAAIDQAHANLGIENPHSFAETPMLKSTLGEITPGAQAADWVMHKGVGNAAGGAVGAAVGGKLGSPTLGALIGAKVLSGPVNKAFNAIIMPMIQKSEVSGAGARAAMSFAAAAIKGESKLDNLTGDIFKAGRSVLTADVAQREKLKSKLDELSEHPENLISEQDHLGHYLPDHSSQLAQLKVQAGQYLQSLKPSTTPLGPMDNAPKVAAEATARYNNALDIANNPGLVLQKIKNGTVTVNDIKDLQGTNQALVSRMQTKVMEQMIEAKNKGIAIPYKTQMALGLFMAQPISASMQPQAIQASQPMQPQGGHSSSGRHNYTGIQKMPNSYMTPQQARASSRTNR